MLRVLYIAVGELRTFAECWMIDDRNLLEICSEPGTHVVRERTILIKITGVECAQMQWKMYLILPLVSRVEVRKQRMEDLCS